MKTNRKIIVGVTGASGAIYANLLIDLLCRSEKIAEVALLITDNGKKVASWENVNININQPKIRLCDNHDMFDDVASGSSAYDSMVILPCSMGTLSRICCGISSDLLGRAADVMIKEKKQLILVPREAPLSTIHLQNMLSLARTGTLIIPAAPSFYSNPSNIEELCMTVVERIADHLDITGERYRWDDKDH